MHKKDTTNNQTKGSLYANNEATAVRLLFQDDIRRIISANWSSASKETYVASTMKSQQCQLQFNEKLL